MVSYILGVQANYLWLTQVKWWKEYGFEIISSLLFSKFFKSSLFNVAYIRVWRVWPVFTKLSAWLYSNLHTFWKKLTFLFGRCVCLIFLFRDLKKESSVRGFEYSFMQELQLSALDLLAILTMHWSKFPSILIKKNAWFYGLS